jgi:hypothetical protein
MYGNLKFITAIIMLALVFSLVSCNEKEKDVTSTVSTIAPIASATVENTTKEATVPAATTDPLPAITDSFKLPVEGIRPFAVMIDNEGTRSLPQGGLDKAQVIYEIIVEGGETRLMPVFWGVDPQLIGPVRSSRHYFLDYAMENDAIYVHFGWSPLAMKDISKFKINNINGVANGGEIFWDITKDKGNWQDSYTSTQKIQGYVEKVKYRTTTDKSLVFKYNPSDIVPLSGQKAEKISIKYSSSYTCGYEYDSTVKLYNRIRKNLPQMERVSGKQLTAKNIIIQYTPSKNIKGDSKGRQEVTTTGSGNGLYITCGLALKLKWSKDTRSSQTHYEDEAGNPILMNPGQTWVQILPLSGKVTMN